MGHYIEVVLKRDFTSGRKYVFENGWKNAVGKLKVIFDKLASEDNVEGLDGNKKTEGMSWQERFGKKGYY